MRYYGHPSHRFNFAVPRSGQLDFFGNLSAKQLFDESVSKLETTGGIKTTIDSSPFLQAARLLYEGSWVAERYVVARWYQ